MTMFNRKTVVKHHANYYITMRYLGETPNIEVRVNGFDDLDPVFVAENIPDAEKASEYFEAMIKEGWFGELYASNYPLTAHDLFGV